MNCKSFRNNSDENSSTYIFSMDNTNSLKGIAILSVVLCHFIGAMYSGKVRFFTPLGGIGVALFLILSSYGLNESWKKVGEKNWWRKRFWAVFIPYFLVQCLFYWPFHSFEIVEFIKDITMIEPKYHNGWFLNYLLVWYFCYYFVMRVDLLRNRKIVIFTTLSLLMFFSLPEIKAEQSLSFLIGVIISEKKDLIKGFIKCEYAALFLFCGILFLAFKQLSVIRAAHQLVINFIQLGIKAPIEIGLGISFCLLNRYYNVHLFKWFRLISYELYLIHGYVLENLQHSVTGIFSFVIKTIVSSLILNRILFFVKKRMYTS